MNAIEIKNVSKVFRVPKEKRSTLKEHAVGLFRGMNYTEFSALKDISFSIRKGEFFGIIGRNGSGKSTLLKIIAGIFVPSSGTVHVHGKISSFLELGVGFNPELTARENIFLYGAILGLSRSEINKKFDSIIKFAELEKFVDAKLKTFSSGMQVRLGFATAIQADADIYLVDEVLAVGDANFQAKCFDIFEMFKRQGKTVVFVSHDLGSVERFCERAILIENSVLKSEGKSKKIINDYMQINLEREEEKQVMSEKDNTESETKTEQKVEEKSDPNMEEAGKVINHQHENIKIKDNQIKEIHKELNKMKSDSELKDKQCLSLQKEVSTCKKELEGIHNSKRWKILNKILGPCDKIRKK